MPSSTRLALVTIATLDVRRRPEHGAELTSQLLLGETVRLLRASPDQRWWVVENLSDGYRGWVRAWGIAPVPAARARKWNRLASARVDRLFVEARSEPGAGVLVSPLLWNSRVIPGVRRGRYRQVVLPDGRRGWVPAGVLAPPGRRTTIVGRVRGLLGVPYLWGGRTPLGFDCSGFTQQVLAEQGVAIPRDADEQFRRGRALPRGDGPRPGDLIFFGAPGRPIGHVGLGLGGGLYAHCRSVVRVSSTDPRNGLYDKDLEPQFRGWRRPRRGARKG